MGNTPLGFKDSRLADANMVDILAVSRDTRRERINDFPAERNPDNPQNRNRAAELIGARGI